MGRPRATPEQRREARNTIRRAAADLVTELGPSRVTARKVATQAGVSVGTVYGHFDSLSDLMRSLWTPVIEEANRKLALTTDAYPDPCDRIAGILREYVALATGNTALHRNTLLFVRPADAAVPERLPADDLDLHRLLTEAIREGQAADRVVDGDPAQLAQLLWAGVHGALALPVNADIYELEPAGQQAQLMIETLAGALHRTPIYATAPTTIEPSKNAPTKGPPMTLLNDPRPISADSHALEGPEVFEGLPEKFGDDAPRVVSKEGRGDFIIIPNIPKRSRNVAYMALAGTRLDYTTPLAREHASKPSAGSLEDPEIQAYVNGGYAAMRPGLTDGARRPDDQDIDGVSAEILYPGWFPMFSLSNLDLMVALQRNYNDWMHQQSVASNGRLVGLAALPVQRPEVAVDELKRVIDLGFKGIVIPSNAPRGRRYCDGEYDPMWAIAEEAGLPVAFHVACMSHVPDWLKASAGRDPVTQYAGSAALIHDTMVELMVRGVCAKFPDLKFVLAEFNAGWVAHWLDKVQQGWAREYSKDSSSAPPVDVLDIWKRQFFATIEDDTAALRTRDLIGEETLLWGSDYPHTDSTWPCSTQVLDEMFENYSAETRDKVTRTNVANLYSL